MPARAVFARMSYGALPLGSSCNSVISTMPSSILEHWTGIWRGVTTPFWQVGK